MTYRKEGAALRRTASDSGSILRDTRGEGYVRICVAVTVLALLFSVILFYAEQVALVKEVREHVQQALEGMAMKASQDSFSEENEGENIAFVWKEDVFYAYMQVYFPLVEQTEAGYRCADAGGMPLWEITGITVDAVSGENLTVKAGYTMRLPVRLGGTVFPDIIVPVRVESTYRLK